MHGERKIDRLIPLTTRQRVAKEKAQDKFWQLYKSLQAYRLEPNQATRATIASEFDEFCQTKTGYPDLNEALVLLHAKRDAFLAVLEHPPLADLMRATADGSPGPPTAAVDSR